MYAAALLLRGTSGSGSTLVGLRAARLVCCVGRLSPIPEATVKEMIQPNPGAVTGSEMYR